MPTSLDARLFEQFQKIIHEYTGVTIAQSRSSMIEGRLRKRLLALKLDNYGDYLQVVRTNSEEKSTFVDLVTTHETSFFRTPRIWDFIENKLLPEWHSKFPGRVFSAWSSAASSGQEAASLGIVCQKFKESSQGFDYRILCSDVSQMMVDLCQKGEFTEKSTASFRKSRPDEFRKFMKSCSDGQYKLSENIRSKYSYCVHNLFQPLKMNRQFDLILLRNVLIYFKTEDQEKLLALLTPRMAQESTLIIGESESLAHVNSAFSFIEPLVYRVGNTKTIIEPQEHGVSRHA